MSPKFMLQYPAAQIQSLAASYSDDDTAMEAAGKRIKNGDYSRENLEIICRWKSPRKLALLRLNSDDDIRAALHAAVSASSDMEALVALTNLHGVGVPMASAILTAIDPDRWTVIDFRALEALGQTRGNPSAPYYLGYLNACRTIAIAAGVSLRMLDRANWQWSRSRSTRIGNGSFTSTCSPLP